MIYASRPSSDFPFFQLLKDLVHSHVSNNADDGLNGMDFGQAESDSYFMTGLELLLFLDLE